MKNKDEKCFKYAVLTGLYEPSDPRNSNRISSYTYCEVQENEPDFSMLRIIGKFEEKNNISVNVYAVDEKERKAGKRKATSDGNELIDDECDDEEDSDMDEDDNIPDLIDADVSDDDLSMIYL